ncbi:response regulator [Synechococcales cyanobacterium C]|uniref:Response regulator n=1 Tax=Petrachloros mirabilis ULC683 TaxID=2781853 RepID=A0A8K2A6J4_9CYAN|nr:response regulator [Petrachloros mirabilis ULC683]
MGVVHVQIIEGNPHLRSLLGWHLQQAGYTVHLSSGLRQGRDLYQRQQPDLVILDADLPDGHSLELCRWLQRQRHPMILMLSAQNSEIDVVKGLKAGADDYLAKPFGVQEFLARVESLSRRGQPTLPAQLRYGDLRIDLIQRRVHHQDELIDLTPQEFSLLYVLVQADGEALSRLELLQRAWPENIDNPRTVDTHILSLRKKIEPEPQQPQLIQTIRNVGYRINFEYLSHLSAQAAWVGSAPSATVPDRRDLNSPRPNSSPPQVTHA